MYAHLLTGVASGALVAVLVARRIHRTIARQALQPKRLWVRTGVLALVATLLAVGATRNGSAAIAYLAGAAAGVLLGAIAIRQTRFETTPQGHFFTPPRAIGLAVIAIFLGRLAYRFLTMPSPGANPDALAMLQRSPLTLASAGLVLGYYLAFNAGVLRWNGRTAAT